MSKATHNYPGEARIPILAGQVAPAVMSCSPPLGKGELIWNILNKAKSGGGHK